MVGLKRLRKPCPAGVSSLRTREWLYLTDFSFYNKCRNVSGWLDSDTITWVAFRKENKSKTVITTDQHGVCGIKKFIVRIGVLPISGNQVSLTLAGLLSKTWGRENWGAHSFWAWISGKEFQNSWRHAKDSTTESPRNCPRLLRTARWTPLLLSLSESGLSLMWRRVMCL